jgi:hypothetical protein
MAQKRRPGASKPWSAEGLDYLDGQAVCLNALKMDRPRRLSQVQCDDVLPFAAQWQAI